MRNIFEDIASISGDNLGEERGRIRHHGGDRGGGIGVIEMSGARKRGIIAVRWIKALKYGRCK